MATKMKKAKEERCAICNCKLHRRAGTYARPNAAGRSHATRHHFVAERFYGRSSNRAGTQRDAIFEPGAWEYEGASAIFCYECHEELLHNPILLPEDIRSFRRLVEERVLSELSKSESDRSALAGRIKLFHEIITRGLDELLTQES